MNISTCKSMWEFYLHGHMDTWTHRHTDTQTHRHTDTLILSIWPVKNCTDTTFLMITLKVNVMMVRWQHISVPTGTWGHVHRHNIWKHNTQNIPFPPRKYSTLSTGAQTKETKRQFHSHLSCQANLRAAINVMLSGINQGRQDTIVHATTVNILAWASGNRQCWGAS